MCYNDYSKRAPKSSKKRGKIIMTKTWYLSNNIKGIEQAEEVAKQMELEVEIEPIEMGWTKFTIIDNDNSRDDFYERMQLVCMEFVDEGLIRK